MPTRNRTARSRDETVVEPASEASLNVRRQQIDISQDNDRLRATRPASPSRTHRVFDQNFQRTHVERVAGDEIEDDVVSKSGLSPSARGGPLVRSRFPGNEQWNVELCDLFEPLANGREQETGHRILMLETRIRRL